MITTGYMGVCPFCKEKIIGRGDYISHLIRETNKAIEAINEAAIDFLSEGYKIVGIKSPGRKNYHLELKKSQEK